MAMEHRFPASSPCLEEEALCVDLMITEQQDTETPFCRFFDFFSISETEYNQESAEKYHVETGIRKKQMQMTVGTTEEPSYSLCGQLVANTGLTAPNTVGQTSFFFGSYVKDLKRIELHFIMGLELDI